MARHSRLARTIPFTVGILLLATCRDDPPMTTEPDGPTAVASVATVEASAEVLVGAGDISSCSSVHDEATAKLLDAIPGSVFTLGDNAYTAGSSAEYSNCYDPTWGRHKARTRPAAGGRDYSTAGAPGYFGYFGSAAGDPDMGYYSYDVGSWHVVVLNSKLSMKAGSPQEQWLRADLAGSDKACTIAYWHLPRFFSYGSTGVNGNIKPLWDALYAAGAEIVVNAEYRFYERFAPQTPDGVIDQQYGLREFIVGTGGSGIGKLGTVHPNSEVRNSGTYGVVRFTLGQAGYTWDFVPVAGQSFTDSGSGECHGPPPPVARIAAPSRAEAGVDITFDGSGSTDLQQDVPLSYEWDFGDGTTGSGAIVTRAYAEDGHYTVTLTVVDTTGSRSEPVSVPIVIENIEPAVDVGPDKWSRTGETVKVTARLKDQPGDSPWNYVIDWGDGTQETGTLQSLEDSIATSHTYATTGEYRFLISAVDKDLGAGADTAAIHVQAPGSPMVFVGAGDISSCKNDNDGKTAALLDAIAGMVFTVGDNAYPSAREADYANCYDPTWGRHRHRTYAALGNHEYDGGSNAIPTFDYFGLGAGPAGKGYYSFDVGDWHIIVLNDNRPQVDYYAGSVQEQWLRADLAANTKQCTLAIWHQPLFYSSHNSTTVRTSRRVLWEALYEAGVEVVLNGHQHHYERFAPQRPDGTRDDATGIRQFIVATGGDSSKEPTYAIAPNSELRGMAFGVLKFTLHAGSYDWELVPIPGQTFTDSGSGSCH